MTMITETNIKQAAIDNKPKRVTKKAQKELDRQRDIATLKTLLKPGDTVYTILKHVSASGMYRRISLVIKTETGIRNISGLVSDIAGYKWCDDDSLGAGGAGMDMGFSIVYNLSRVLFPKGFPVVTEEFCNKCQDRPGFNGLGEMCQTCKGTGIVSKPKRGRNGDESGWDNDGGYALKHSWL